MCLFWECNTFTDNRHFRLYQPINVVVFCYLLDLYYQSICWNTQTTHPWIKINRCVKCLFIKCCITKFIEVKLILADWIIFLYLSLCFSLYNYVASSRPCSLLPCNGGAPARCRHLLCTGGFSSSLPSVSMMWRCSWAGSSRERGPRFKGKMRKQNTLSFYQFCNALLHTW